LIDAITSLWATDCPNVRCSNENLSCNSAVTAASNLEGS
jgi:hypothetical protein